MKTIIWLLTALLIVLHQDLWNWGSAQPLLFGFVPVGLWYHAIYVTLCAMLMALLVRRCWPAHLESATPETPEARSAEGASIH